MLHIDSLIQTLAKGGPVMISREGLIYLEREAVDAARLAGVVKLAIAVAPREAKR